MHNVQYQLSLMQSIREAILQDRYPDFIREFFDKFYGSTKIPQWAVDALRGVGVDLL